MAVTITDIAAVAQVDASTVSRALRGDPRVRRETREFICQLAEDMAYVPNRGARQLAGGKSGVVVLSAGNLDYEYLAPAADTLSKELFEYGYLVMVLPDSHRQVRFLQTLQLFEQRFCDAAVLFSPPMQEDGQPELTRLQESGFPIVCIDQWLSNYAFPGISNDAAKSISLLGERMITHRITAAAVHFPADNTVSLFRRSQAEKFLQERNIPYVTDLNMIPELLKKHSGARFGIFADNPALMMLDELLADSPPEVCVGCMFDSWKFKAPKCFDAIYLCIQDVVSTSCMAAECIMQMLRGVKDIDKLILIPPKEIIVPNLK